MSDPLVPSAGHPLREHAVAMAEAVVAYEFGRRPELRIRYGSAGRGKFRQAAVCHFLHLADTLDTHSAALFNDYIGWVKVLQGQQGVRADDLDHQLGCMADVVREQMPPRAAALAVAMIEGARAALPAMPDTTTSSLDTGQALCILARDYMHALLGGYRGAAARLVFEAADRGEPIQQLYLKVFQPVLHEIGRLWQMNKISVAQEHFCSACSQIVMSQLLARAPAAERCGHGVVIVSISGDLHDLGARMVGDFFEMAGWDSYFCGANTPTDAVVQLVAERTAGVLAVSATMGCHLHAVQELVGRVRAEPGCARLRVMVGGHPFTVDPALWRTVGADGTAADADAAVTLASEWMAGLGSAP